MPGIARRTFISSTFFGGLGLLSTARFANAGTRTRESLAVSHIRRNVYCLNASSPEIRAYKRAIQVMRAKPATDPTSWQAQSNIHKAFKPDPTRGVINICPPATPADLVAPPGMINGACQHSNFFLAWHRMYLYYFERIVRAASGDPDFALPYWAYSPTGRRDLPDVFRIPNTTANALWTDQRAPVINAGGNIAASSVDSTTALGNIAYGSFQNSLNGTPHGVVHGAVGDGCGWMSYFETAAMDPIFWLHHCNIDRLWEDWIASGGGRVNPTTDPAWMNQSYTFYDEAGATVTLRVSQILDTAVQLDHRYAPPNVCPTRPFCFCVPLRPWLEDIRLVELGGTIVRRPPLPDPIAAAQVKLAPLTLGATPARVKLPIDPAVRKQLSAFLTDQKAGRNLKLVVDDVRLLRRPAIFYEVYVNLPAGDREMVYTSPYYIGNLDFFTSASPDHNGFMREFDLVMPFVRLKAMGRWPDDTLAVTFVPKSFVEGGNVARELGDKPQATIGRVSVVIE